MQLESTAATGRISLGTGTRFTRWLLSTSEVVPVSQAKAKKLNGTSPHITEAAKSGVELFWKIRVNTKVKTPIMIRGFSNDQKIPSDILRYLTRKSFRIRLESRNK